MSRQRFYQVEGYEPDLIENGRRTYDLKRLAQTIAIVAKRHNGDLFELILGIKIRGSSHILLTERQKDLLTDYRKGQPPPPLRLSNGARGRYASDFESLSPIIFKGEEDLAKRLRTFQPKSNKGRNQRPGDSSQANNSYIGPNAILRDHPQRGAFEHSRLMHRILDSTVEPEIYGATNISWKDGLRIRALALNVDPHDTRPSHERKLSPKVLDIGICDAKTSMSPIPDYTTTRHIRNPQNRFLNARPGKLDYVRDGQNLTEVPANQGEFLESISSIFADCREKTASPVILLVHDEERTLNFLKAMNLDTADWRSGIKDLVNPGDALRVKEDYDQGRYSQRGYGHQDQKYDYRNNDRYYKRSPSPRRGYDYNRGNDRSYRRRSPSPRRGYIPDRKDFKQERDEGRWQGNSRKWENGRDWKKEETPEKKPQRPYAPVYIVDVLRMYKTLMQTNAATDPINDNIVLLAKLLDIGGVEETNWWCAGKEASLLIEMWSVMASGADLDTERVLSRDRGRDEEEEEEVEEMEHLQDDSDDDADPNVERAAQGSAGPHTSNPSGKGKGKDYYGFDDSNSESDSDSD